MNGFLTPFQKICLAGIVLLLLVLPGPSRWRSYRLLVVRESKASLVSAALEKSDLPGILSPKTARVSLNRFSGRFSGAEVLPVSEIQNREKGDPRLDPYLLKVGHLFRDQSGKFRIFYIPDEGRGGNRRLLQRILNTLPLRKNKDWFLSGGRPYFRRGIYFLIWILLLIRGFSFLESLRRPYFFAGSLPIFLLLPLNDDFLLGFLFFHLFLYMLSSLPAPRREKGLSLLLLLSFLGSFLWPFSGLFPGSAILREGVGGKELLPVGLSFIVSFLSARFSRAFILDRSLESSFEGSSEGASGEARRAGTRGVFKTLLLLLAFRTLFLFLPPESLRSLFGGVPGSPFSSLEVPTPLPGKTRELSYQSLKNLFERTSSGALPNFGTLSAHLIYQKNLFYRRVGRGAPAGEPGGASTSFSFPEREVILRKFKYRQGVLKEYPSTVTSWTESEFREMINTMKKNRNIGYLLLRQPGPVAVAYRPLMPSAYPGEERLWYFSGLLFFAISCLLMRVSPRMKRRKKSYL